MNLIEKLTQLIEQEDQDIEFAKLSMAEEEKAIIDYTKRMDESKDTILKKILNFLIQEERNHRQMLNDWLDGERIDPGVPDPKEKKEGSDI